MNTDFYEDMDPDYRSRIFMARKKLLGSLDDPTLLPENGLNARSILDEDQLSRVKSIRNKKLATVMHRFQAD